MKSIIELAKEKAAIEVQQSQSTSQPMSFNHEKPMKKSVIPNKDEQVLVMNNTTGILIMANKTTKETRTLENYGSKEYYDVSFLMGIKTILANAQLIILEEDEAKPITNFLVPYKEVRESILTDEDVTDVLNTMNGHEFNILLNSMHGEVASLLCQLIFKLHTDGELHAKDSYGIRDAVSRYLNKPELFVIE